MPQAVSVARGVRAVCGVRGAVPDAGAAGRVPTPGPPAAREGAAHTGPRLATPAGAERGLGPGRRVRGRQVADPP